MAKVVRKIWVDEDGVREFESFESMMKRFKKKVSDEGIIQQMRAKDYYVGYREKKRLKKTANMRKIKLAQEKQKEKELAFERGKRYIAKR